MRLATAVSLWVALPTRVVCLLLTGLELCGVARRSWVSCGVLLTFDRFPVAVFLLLASVGCGFTDAIVGADAV